MRLIYVPMPVTYVDALQRLVDEGTFPNRPEAIRVALRDFLKEELGLMEKANKLFESPKPRTLTDAERAYYRETWGFDPEVDRTHLPSGDYRYEAAFPLPQDPELANAGVMMVAQVTFTPRITPASNRIVFRCDGREAAVTCVHTVVCKLSPQEFQQVQEEGLIARASAVRQEPAQLPPEEHFVALKSYVAGVADLGIRNAFQATYMSEQWNPETLPVGFNIAMQTQVVRSLRQVAPRAAAALVRDLLFEIVEAVPSNWIRSRIQLLDSIYGFTELVHADPSFSIPKILRQ